MYSLTMGGKSSKPVTGENGVITYKVDIFGGNIRQKFDSGKFGNFGNHFNINHEIFMHTNLRL